MLTASTLLTEVNREDGRQTYVLAGVHCRVWPQKLVRNNRGYVISEYILSDTFYREKGRDRAEAYTITENTL